MFLRMNKDLYQTLTQDVTKTINWKKIRILEFSSISVRLWFMRIREVGHPKL